MEHKFKVVMSAKVIHALAKLTDVLVDLLKTFA